MIFNGLNDDQKKAVEYRGHSLIQACPGSGKTHVLTRKIAYELELLEKSGNSKQYIVGLTFTNRAADEIKKRVSALGQRTRQLWVGTIHSFCLEWILRPYAGYHPHLKNGFVIIDETKAKEVKVEAKEATSSTWYAYDLKTVKTLQGDLVCSDSLVNAVEKYYEILRENRYVDFNSILYDSLQLLTDYPTIGKHLSDVFNMILVDEYQDIQEYQYAIIHEIIGANAGKTTLYYVGDPNQAIYTSLGGVAKSKQEIEAEAGITLHDGISLKGCYRSTQRVINYYSYYQVATLSIESRNDLIKDSQGRITHDGTVHKDDVMGRIIQLIREAKERGVPDNEICVIAPAWYLLFQLGRELRASLPEVDFDAPGLFLFRPDPFNTYFQMARLFLTDPTPRLFPYRMRWTKELLDELLAANDYALPEKYNSPRDLLRLLNSISSSKEEGVAYLEELTEKFLRGLDIDTDSNFTISTHRDSFLKNMRNRIADNPEIPNDSESLKKMFQKRRGVVVNTCHGVKGEEYDTVIAFGILEGRIPYHRGSADKEVEARKLLYVISSRAKSHLHLISETGRFLPRTEDVMPTTRIVSEHQYAYD